MSGKRFINSKDGVIRINFGKSFLRLSLTAVALSGFWNTSLSANTLGIEERVRVRLAANEKSLQISGLALSLSGESSLPMPVGLPKRQELNIERVQIKDSHGVPVWQWKIELGHRVELRAEPFLLLSGEFVSLRDLPMPKQVLLFGKKNLVDVIGVMPLEEYLVGVVASEMPTSWPIEALRSQAIAARSYALATMSERRDQVFQLESNTNDQVYRVILRGEGSNIDRARQAVVSTRGEVLRDRVSGRILKAYYYADCGGFPSSAKKVWSMNGRTAVFESTCLEHHHAKWEYSISDDDLRERLLSSLTPLQEDPGLTVTEILPETQDDKLAKSHQVQIRLSNGSVYQILADRFRFLMGYDQMRSTNFSVNHERGEWHLSGLGLGHGVGLCQEGARALARQSLTGEHIVIKYYPQSLVVRL